MDLHRLRVVEFDTLVPLVSEKKVEKYNAKLEEHEQADCKSSSGDKKDKTNETVIENKCLDDNTSPSGLWKIGSGENTIPPGLSKKGLGDIRSPPGPPKRDLGGNTSPLGPSKEGLNDNISTTGSSKKNLGDRISPSGASKKGLNDTKSPPATSKCLGETINCTSRTSKTLSFIKRKPKSEIFKIPSTIKPRKLELKNNSSLVDLTKLFEDRAHSHQKKRTLNLFNRKSRVDQKVEDVKENKQNNKELHFLFARKTPGFVRYRRKRADNEVKGKKKKRDYNFLNDIYGFQKNNRYIDPYLYQMSCNYLNIDKLPFKKMRTRFHRKPKKTQSVTNCICKHHAMRVLSSVRNDENPSIYYNLNTHYHPRRTHHKRDYDQEEALRRERSYYMAKHETVGVSPSSLNPVIRHCCDACTGPSKVELSAPSRGDPPFIREACPANQQPQCRCNQKPYLQHSTPSPSATQSQNKPHVVTSTKKRKKTKKAVINQRKRLFSGVSQKITAFHIKSRPSGKNFIKYILFGLLIVVWSPCLLVVILAWVVMCPVRITNIIKTDTSERSFPMMNSFMNRFRKKDPGCKYQRMCFENCLLENNKSFMSSVASWYSRAVGTVLNSFNAMISMLKLKNKPTCAGSSFLTSTHPNPRKRYTLFYTHNRGWMMKPLRPRPSNSRSNASTRVVHANMRCESIPTFWRKSRCDKKCQTKIQSLRKKSCECPVHGSWRVSCYPKHQSSPAGDASPMLTKPEPGCICWDSYSTYPGNGMSRNKLQGSSMFIPVASRRLQHQQRYSSGHGRKGSAAGGVQQQQYSQPAKQQLPYPAFNRVSMLCPGHNSPRKQSERVHPSANYYYPPAYGATPRPNHVRYPCYINPANKCGPRHCYDEDALRCAYKRRPLRYIPPRQQLPKIAMAKQKKKRKKVADLKKKKKLAAIGNKLTQCCRCVRDLVYQAEKDAWPVKVSCRPMWIHALKRRPCFWIYECWPSMYRAFLSCYRFQQNICQMLMYVIAICFWCPLIFGGYFCCDLICRSL